MLKNENIICISSIDWDFIWQGHQEIMSNFAKNGNKVLFIENTGARSPGIKDYSRIKNRIKNWIKGVKGIREEIDNLYVFSPIVLPFPYSRIARWINRRLMLVTIERWMRSADFTNPIIWTFLPTPLSIDIADNLTRKLFIYYCIDNFAASSAHARKIKQSEKTLLSKVDMVFTTSRELYNYCSGYNKQVYTFPFGVNFSQFERVSSGSKEKPLELKDIRPPMIGYVGGVHKWIDLDLIKKAAENHPEYSFVFIGPVQTDVSRLSGLKNIYFLGKKDHEILPCFIKAFDACIIPYLITDYTNNVYPTKLNEYLALGKGVVSTALPEVCSFNSQFGEDLVYIAHDVSDFSSLIRKAMDEKGQEVRDKRINVARQNSWENRMEEMCALIEKEIQVKEAFLKTRWKENLINIYRLARKRFLSILIPCVIVLFVLFKTDFLWWVASPLKIEDAPKKADVIVAFGGGVGETGSPGKSTIERARYAVDLYKAGYSDKIIFSSGYWYNYNDAESMKFLALSMGVDDEDIILEQQANSTYENVIFTNQIMNKYGWGSFLLISSPYNMRRASLVLDAYAKDKEVAYMPVKYSQFYDRIYGVRLEQINAIIHEYLGILYYFFKGYI